MSLRLRIWLIPLVSACLFAIGIATAAWFANATSRTVQSLGDTRFPYLDLTTRLDHGVDKLASLYQSAAFEADLDRLADARAKKLELAGLTAEIAALDGMTRTADTLVDLLNEYGALSTRAVQILTDEDGERDPTPVIERMQASKERLDAALSAAREEALSGFTAAQRSVALGVSRGLQVLVASAVVIVTVLGLISWIVIASIWSQLGCEPRFALETMERIARGDLSTEMTLRRGDRSSLLSALIEMRDSLSRIVGEVRHGTDSITGVSAQLAAGNRDLSSRTEAQADELTRTSGSMSQLATIVRQNADSANEANQLAGSAARIASQGGEAVGEIVTTMKGIRDSSTRIAAIIGLIDDIAFQTNILALNAAVESARAGEHGRGFAVVAGEVRTLAHSSAKAASEVSDLIKASVDQAEAASERVHKAGDTIGQAVDAVGQVTGIIESIAVASATQADQLRQITDAVSRMDDSTQRNASAVEQAAAAAATMQEQAQRLSELVASFTLTERTVPDSPSASLREAS